MHLETSSLIKSLDDNFYSRAIHSAHLKNQNGLINQIYEQEQKQREDLLASAIEQMKYKQQKKLEIRKNNEWEFWMCKFDDGSECEERDFFNWECLPLEKS